jgi:hypothetical protein
MISYAKSTIMHFKMLVLQISNLMPHIPLYLSPSWFSSSILDLTNNQESMPNQGQSTRTSFVITLEWSPCYVKWPSFAGIVVTLSFGHCTLVNFPVSQFPKLVETASRLYQQGLKAASDELSKFKFPDPSQGTVPVVPPK